MNRQQGKPRLILLVPSRSHECYSTATSPVADSRSNACGRRLLRYSRQPLTQDHWDCTEDTEREGEVALL